jgi:hypothetical protein
MQLDLDTFQTGSCVVLSEGSMMREYLLLLPAIEPQFFGQSARLIIIKLKIKNPYLNVGGPNCLFPPGLATKMLHSVGLYYLVRTSVPALDLMPPPPILGTFMGLCATNLCPVFVSQFVSRATEEDH